ncbi:hypothetical protein niasHS_009652 [Heterodera schachtii]|uniref:Anaphase-promoting complex subunit 11 n=2 Tax=Heterodera TaxID=34509 RepID=A0ABD2ME95_9BILA
MMSSNEEEESGGSNDDQFSSPISPVSPIQPMSTDWSNAIDAQEMGAGGVGGGISSGSLHESLHELSPIWADSDLIGDTLSAVPDSPSDEDPYASTIYRPVSMATPVAALPNPNPPSCSFGGPMESIEAKGPLELPTKTRLKVRIKRLDIVGSWRWVDGKEDACGICRTPFETCCMDCKFPGDECPLVLGQCKHPFHMHCIVKWTNTQSGQKPACPLCRQEWKFATS